METGCWTGLAAGETFHQLKTFCASWKEKYNKEDPELLSSQIPLSDKNGTTFLSQKFFCFHFHHEVMYVYIFLWMSKMSHFLTFDSFQCSIVNRILLYVIYKAVHSVTFYTVFPLFGIGRTETAVSVRSFAVPWCWRDFIRV